MTGIQIRGILIGACLLAAYGCAHPAEEKPEPIAPVQVGPVTQESMRRLVEADGVLFPLNQSPVQPNLTAPVTKFFVNRGDHVKEGQMVATLENRALSAAAVESKGQVDQAEANLRAIQGATVPDQVTKAQTDVESAQEQFDAAKRLLDSRKDLLQKGALAHRQVDEAQVQYVQAQSQLRAAQEHLRAINSVGNEEQIKTAAAQVESARAHYQSALAQVGYSEVHSPISGIVSDRPLYVGDVASSGSPLLTVMDISSVIAKVNVPQAQAAFVKIGNQATITQTSAPQEIAGRVTVVSPATDAASTTVQVWVQAANPGERLKPGSSVHVALVTEVLKNVTVVPAGAILPAEEGGNVVAVPGADNTIHLKKVEVGVRDGGKVQILSGVSPGDTVITVGGLGLDDNAKIRIVKPGAEEEAPPEPPPAAGKDQKK